MFEGSNPFKKKIFETNNANPRLSSHSSSQRDQRSIFKDSPLRSVNKNKENDDSMTSNSALLDLKSPGLDFSLPPTYKQDKAQLKKLQEKDLSFRKNPRMEGHPPDADMEDSQQFRNKEADQLRRKNQELDRENLHLKNQLASLENKLKKGFDQEKEILDKLAQLPQTDSIRKMRDLMKEVNWWQERFAKSEQQLEEFRDLPRIVEDLKKKLDVANYDTAELKNELDQTKEKLNRLTQQKARVEGELQGKGDQISKLNELEAERNNARNEALDWKNKFDKLNAKFTDKDSIEGKYANLKQTLQNTESKLNVLTKEIERLNGVILEKKMENDKLKGRSARLDQIQLMYQNERERKDNEIKSLRARLGEDGSPKKKFKNAEKELKLRTTALENELARAREDIKTKILDNENLKKDIADLRVELSLKDDLKEELDYKDKRIKAIMDEANRLNEDLGRNVGLYEKNQMKLEEYENKIIMLTTEIQRLNQLLRSKNEENDVMRLRFGELDSKLQSQKEKYEEKIKALNAESEKIKAKLKTSEAAKAMEINHLKIKLDDFKKSDKEKPEEGKEQEAAAKAKSEPIEDIKRRMKREIMQLDQENKMLKEDKDHIWKQAEMWREELEKLENDQYDTRGEKAKRIAHAENFELMKSLTDNRSIKDQLDQANEEMYRMRLENNELKSRMGYIEEDKERIIKQNQDLERLYNQAKNAHSVNYSEIDNLQRAKSEHQLARNNLERELQNLGRQYEDLKYRYASLEMESKMAIQRAENEYGAKMKLMENDLTAKNNIMLEIKAREKIDETYDARTVEYEEKIAFFAGECEKLKLILLDKEEEIQEVKAKLAEIENLEKEELQEKLMKVKHMLEIKLNELDGVILQKQQMERVLEEHRESGDEITRLRELLERKNLEMKGLIESSGKIEQIIKEKELLENELTKLSRILENKIEENEEWKDRFQRLEGALSEKGGLEARYLDNEDKKMRLLNEMERLARESKQKSQENEQLLRKMRNLEIAMADSMNLQNEIIRLKNLLEEKLEEIDSWKSKCSRYEAILNDKESLEGRAMEYERKIEVLVKDIEKLGYVYREKTRENEELKQVCGKYEAQISDRGLLEGEIRKIKDILEGKLQEIDNLKARNSGLELALSNKDGFSIKSREYEEKIRVLSGELEKVSMVLRDKNDEIEGWRLKCTRVETNQRDRDSIEGEVKKMRGILEIKLQEIEDLKALNNRYEMKIADCQDCDGKLGESQRKIEFLHREIEKISGVLRGKHEENEALRLKCNRYETMIRDEEVLSAEFNKMKEILERKLTEIDQYKSRCSQLELRLAENGNNEDQQRENERKMEIIAREMEKLSSVLKEKMEEIEDWRVKCSRLESTQRDSLSLQDEIRRLSEILQSKLREIDEWRSKYAKLEIYLAENSGSEQKYDDYERKIEKLAQEIERLGTVLQDKMRENEDIRVKLQRSETQLRDTEVLEKELRNMKEILGGKLLENDDLRANNSRFEYLLNEKGNYDGKLREYEDKISLLANELEKISRILSEKMEENEELRVLLTKEINGNRDKDYLNNEIGRLKEVLNAKIVENEELKAKLGQISAMKSDLRAKEQENALLNQELARMTNNVIPEKNLIIEQMRFQISEKDTQLQQGGMVMRDLEKMRELIGEKNKELDNLREIIANYDKNKTFEIENLAKILETKRIAHVETNVRANNNQIEEIKAKLKETLVECDAWRLEAEKLRALVDELRAKGIQTEEERRIKEQLIMEIERLKVILMEKDQEIEALKKGYGEKQYLVEENERMRQEIANLKAELDKFRNDLTGHSELLILIDNLKREIETLRRENDYFRKELDRNLQDQEKLRQDIENSISEDNLKDLERKLRELKHDLEEKNKELEAWKSRYLQLEAFIQQKQGILPITSISMQDPNLMRQIQEWKEKYEILQRELEEKSFIPQEHEHDLEKYLDEIKRLEGLLNERTQELNGVMNVLDPIRTENAVLREKIDLLIREREEMQHRLMNPRMEGQLSMEKNEENKNVKRMLGDKIHEIDSLKEKIEENEKNSKEKDQQIEKLKKGMLEIGNLYKKDMGIHERKKQEMETEVNVLKNLMKEVESNMKSKNKEEMQDLRKSGSEKLKCELMLKQKRIEDLETRKLDLELEVLAKKGLESKVIDYQNNLAKLNEQINVLRNEIFAKEGEISSLKEKVMNLEHENFLSSLKRKKSYDDISGFSERKNRTDEKKGADSGRWVFEDDKIFERPVEK